MVLLLNATVAFLIYIVICSWFVAEISAHLPKVKLFWQRILHMAWIAMFNEKWNLEKIPLPIEILQTEIVPTKKGQG